MPSRARRRSRPRLLAKIEGLKAVYELDLTAADAHHLSEGDPP